MSGNRAKWLPILTILVLLALASTAMAGQAMSRILVNEPTSSYHKPRVEKPPYSAVLADEHHLLVGLGPKQDREFNLADKYGKDVLAFLGPAPKTHFGENDDSLYCYTSSRPGDDTAVVFVVYPDWLMRVHVHSDKARILKRRERCKEADTVSATIRTKGGLRLGMTRAEVIGLFGPPHRVTDNCLEYSSERPSRPGEFGQTVWRSQQIWIDKSGHVSGFSILANTLD